MAARLKARLDHARPVIKERPNRVTNNLGARKYISKFGSGITGFGHFVVCSLDSRDAVHHVFDLLAVPAGCDKGHVVLAEKFSHEAS
jgi:hypothetical protein